MGYCLSPLRGFHEFGALTHRALARLRFTHVGRKPRVEVARDGAGSYAPDTGHLAPVCAALSV